MIIHLGDGLLRRSSDLPGNVSRPEERELRRTTFNNASLFGLAPQGVCLAEHVATLAGDAFTSPFHHRPARRAR